MNHKLLITSLFSLTFLILDNFLLCSCYDFFTVCSNKYRCGTIEADFPFIGGDRPDGCGYPGLKLSCERDKLTTINIRDVKYQVSDLNQEAQTLRIARADFMDGICSPRYRNTSLDTELFDYLLGSTDITLAYGCPSDVNFLVPNDFKCSGERGFVLLGNPGNNGGGVCRSVVNARVEMSDADFSEDIFNVSALEKALREGFGVKYKVDIQGCEDCKKSGGVCGYDINLSQTTCYCANRLSVSGVKTCNTSTTATESGSQMETPENESAKKDELPKSIGLSIAGACILGMFIGGVTYYLIQRKKRKAALAKSRDLSTPPSSKGNLVPSTNFSQTTPSASSFNTFSKSDIEKGSTYFGVQVFSYVELEEATDNFDPSRELGEGGFGTVYYGKLRDGRVVAVKRLYENSFKRVEQFMNEVEILTRLEHHNLVKLYGCTSRRSRELLLVYEFIPNGTVADHLHGKQSNSSTLSWPVRLSIAIETADALAYLHRTDIIHRDVKTNNILLDDEFRVKVADFGLSKLFPNDVTHVSTAPQGTPGYVDPEYYQCYQLTTKSDVYSFGVVLIELISSLQAVDTNRHRHDINLANMAITKIQNHLVGELVDPSLGFESDEKVRKMATDVAELAFRCLQQEKDMRPSMEEVLSALKAIRDEDFSHRKPDVFDIRSDDVGLLKSLPPPFSPDSVATDKWISNSTTPNSY